MKKIIYAVALICSSSFIMSAQEFKVPVPSPLVQVKQDFSTSFIELTYSRPSANGRKIFGDMIQYGKVWRTGANNATIVHFGEDVIIEGKTLKAGKYSMYTIPNKDSWEFVFNTNTGGWGSVKSDTDVLRVKTNKVNTSNYYINTLLIDVNNITNNSAEIVVSWENTVASLPLKVENDKAITDYYEQAINNPRIPYQQAAQYYLSQNKNLDKAAAYADKAIAQNPNAFWLHSLKGKILFKQGKKAEAIKAQEKALDLAKDTPYKGEQELLLKSYK